MSSLYPKDYDHTSCIIGSFSSNSAFALGRFCQMNMFSDRSYEWWEAGNRLNADTESQVYYGTGIRNLNDNGVSKNNKRTLKLHTNSTYEDSHSAFSNEEYQHPFEDEFSQEVFYED